MPEFKKPWALMIHDTGVSHERNPDQVKLMGSLHQEKWESKSSLNSYVGFHYEINKAGRAAKHREDGEPSRAYYRNDMDDGRCIHIALDGDFDIEHPSPNQLRKLKSLLKEKTEEYKIDPKSIYYRGGKNLEEIYIRSLVDSTALLQEPPIKEKLTKTLEYLLQLVRKL